MIGCLLTGHGSFAPGLQDALEMIAGTQENFEVVPFREEEPMELYQENITVAIKKLKGTGEELIIFCDLLGGTPFNVSMMACQNLTGVEVIAGTNLALLIECVGMRLAEMPMEQLLEHIIEIGKNGIVRASFVTEVVEDEPEEGI